MRRLSPAERQAILSTLPPTKVCPQCGIEKKSIDCLLSRRVRKDGPHYDLSHCLACHRAGMADYRADPRVVPTVRAPLCRPAKRNACAATACATRRRKTPRGAP
jgi:hypothetical protein